MDQQDYLGRRRAGILDVAARAGVSRQTVTRAMNDMPGISAETKARVLDAARELHYRPSRFGRGLVTSVAPSLGLVVVDLTNSFWAELASCVLDAARRRGWAVLLVEGRDGGASAVESLLSQVDAVIGHVEMDEPRIEETFGAMPLVLFEREAQPSSRATITLDFGPGVDDAVQHLVDGGRRRIAMLDWSLTDVPSQRSVRFVESVRARGLDVRVLRTHTDADPHLDSGRSAVQRTLERWPDTDAIFCFNDVVAIGAIKELADRGVVVPDQVAVVGMDGLSLGLVVTPELTTLRLDFQAVADEAVELAIAVKEGRAPVRGVAVHRRVVPELTVRRST